MKSLLLSMALIMVSAPALACSYSRLENLAGNTLDAARQAELKQDNERMKALRAHMGAICLEDENVPVSSCQNSAGLCSRLTAEQQAKFAYPEQGYRYQLSKEDREQAKREIDALYKKWGGR